MLKQYRLRDYNFRLLIYMAVLGTFGVLLVGSADASLRNRQLVGLLAGMIITVVISLIDYSWVLYFHRILYILNIALLVMVLLYGSNKKGASRWMDLGFIQFQPTELAKVIIVLFFAGFFMKHEKDLNTFKTILLSLILIAIPLGLILRQPDLKNTLTILVLFCILVYAAGLSYKNIGKALLIILPIVVTGFLLITQTDLPILSDYQKDRIMSFLDSDNDAYSEDIIQQNNSIMAIGSGRLTGKGLNNDDVNSSNKGNFVAENQNDFIFAVAGEELGFAGCIVILALEFLISFECILTGIRAKDKAGNLICCGAASLTAVQGFINICVATGLMPNTGTNLPFVSYGLTSLLSLCIIMGFVLNVGLQRKRYTGKAGQPVRLQMERDR